MEGDNKNSIGLCIASGETLSYPFNLNALHSFKAKTGEVIFKVTSKDPTSKQFVSLSNSFLICCTTRKYWCNKCLFN